MFSTFKSIHLRPHNESKNPIIWESKREHRRLNLNSSIYRNGIQKVEGNKPAGSFPWYDELISNIVFKIFNDLPLTPNLWSKVSLYKGPGGP